MIYDLSELAKEFDEAIDQADAVRTSGRALLAIAERLEALVEAQKPRWVEFETKHGSLEQCNLAHIVRITNFNCNDGEIKLISSDMKSDEVLIVKGTLAEVMAKLKGEVKDA